jgi:hypothetical protein
MLDYLVLAVLLLVVLGFGALYAWALVNDINNDDHVEHLK